MDRNRHNLTYREEIKEKQRSKTIRAGDESAPCDRIESVKPKK